MKPLLASFAALLLAACATVGPEYHGPHSALPDAPAATGRFASQAHGPFVDQPVPGQWWKLYDDPRLDALITRALAANTDLRVAAANIARARAVLAETQTSRQVQTGISGGVSLDRPSGTGEALPGDLGYDAGITASKEIDLVGRLRRLIEAAGADADAAQAAYDLSRITVAADVAGAYAQICTAGYQRAAAQRSLDLQEQSLALTNRLIAGGRGTALDRSQAEALVEQLRAAIPGFEAARQNALFRLAVLLGRPPAEYPRDLANCDTPPRLSAPIPVGNGNTLIRRRPDIREAERNVAAASARIGVAIADLYPRISLGAGLGSTAPLSSLGSGSSFSFSLGPLVSWTFPNRNAVRSRIVQAQASEQAAVAQFDGTVLSALQQVESAMTSYARELDRNASLRRARDHAATAADQARRLYRFGRANAFTVLDAERTLASAEAALAASDALLPGYQISLFLALGGGWEGPAPANPA